MDKSCSICGSIFQVKPSHFSKRDCCSKQCRYEKQKIIFKGKENPNYRGRDKKLIKCKVCGTNFKPRSLYSIRSICSPACSARHTSIRFEERRKILELVEQNKQPKKIILKKKYICSCGREMNRKNKTCSTCRQNKYDFLNTKCLVCGKKIRSRTRRTQKKTCGETCYKTLKSKISNGYNNPNWKGGIMPENKRQRQRKEYVEWRDAVYKRDNYTCQDCGKKGGHLNAHHILEFSKYPHLRTELSNGKTLCSDCHSRCHPSMNFSKKSILRRRAQLKIEFK